VLTRIRSYVGSSIAPRELKVFQDFHVLQLLYKTQRGFVLKSIWKAWDF